MDYQLAVVGQLDLLVGQENGRHQDNLALDSCIRLVRLYYLKIGVDLIVVAVLVVALESLQPRVDPIEHDLLLNQLLNHQLDGLLTQKCEEGNLEIFEDLF